MPLYSKGLIWATPICLDDVDVIQRIYGEKTVLCSDDEDVSAVDEDAEARLIEWPCSADDVGGNENPFIQSGDARVYFSADIPQGSVRTPTCAVMGKSQLLMDCLVEQFNAFENDPAYLSRHNINLIIEIPAGHTEWDVKYKVEMEMVEGYEADDEENAILTRGTEVAQPDMYRKEDDSKEAV